MGAFDYAANAWGYTYGAAAQWYQGPWTFSAGAFDLSQIPNGEKLDMRFGQQMQYVAQIERRYRDLGPARGDPRALFPLTWHARQLWRCAGPGGTNRRRSQHRQCAGRAQQGWVRHEHPAADYACLGVFARASANNGGVEADEYTDISQSVSAGLSLAGNGWGRPNDTFGLAGAVNTISHEAKEYFAAGGLGVLIGDGQLPEAGPEQILETYYSVPVGRYVHVTTDYQLINNPGYNRQRGPVSVFMLRLHAQF